MPYVDLQFPPGVWRNGTERQARGRWHDSFLVRWHEGALMPIGGWDKLEDSSGDIDLAGAVLGMFAWRDNDGDAHLLMGLHDEVHHFSEGTVTDLTPSSGFTAGNENATISGDYGVGNYGDGPYGTGDLTTETVVEAQSWQFDAFGQIPVALAWSDGDLMDWDLNTGNNFAVIAGAPTSNTGLVVTPERFLVALGADGDVRLVKWSDQEDRTTWTPASTNQAGDFPLSTSGEIMASRRGRSETLIWTTVDLWSMRYVGGTGVYAFQKVGNNCGVISRRAMAAAEGRWFWMGHHAFYHYAGQVQEIPSSVGDYVWSDVNRLQASKFHAIANADFSEVEFFYCSSGSSDIDRSVAFNYAENHWTINGSPNRTAGVDRGVFDRPLRADLTGAIYRHETGTSYLDTDDSTSLSPYAESGPLELGKGDRTMLVQEIVPDELTLGDVTGLLYTRDYPTATERTSSAITMTEPTPVRVAGRTVRVRFTQSSPGWRVGVPRLDVRPAGHR